MDYKYYNSNNNGQDDYGLKYIDVRIIELLEN